VAKKTTSPSRQPRRTTGARRTAGRSAAAPSPHAELPKPVQDGVHTSAPAATPAAGHRFIVLTGLSGSGKSQAMRALEDLGYFCVDNLPLTLLSTFAELTQRPDTEIDKAAVVIDVRERALLSQFPKIFRELRKMQDLNPTLIFLDASDAAIVRRFSETRRPHPLAPHKSAIEGLREERARLAPIRQLADEIIDTSDLNVHELREAFMSRSLGAPPKQRGPQVTLLSFGFKHGLPLDADLVFDVRFLPNPHFVAKLRPRTGRERPIVEYLNQFPETHEFLSRVVELLKFLLPKYAREGKSYVTVAIGCTGGRHRSVALAEAIARELKGVDGVRLRVKHRDVAND
jgi:UPF0042 nucleotide-binding protein